MSEWSDYYNPSLTSNYTTLSSTISGSSGGVLSGSVTGYDDDFAVQILAGSFSGSLAMELKVPTEGVPVYQLLPSGSSFSPAVTVSLNYSLWIDEGEITDGQEYEVFYMNEEDEKFVRFSPPLIFTADEDLPEVVFNTTHFSRWVIKKVYE